MIERAEAAPPNLLMTVKREVHFFNAVAFGARAERSFGAGRAAAEQDAVRWIHKTCADASPDMGVRSRYGVIDILVWQLLNAARRQALPEN
jgi:hypothetical protein